MDASKLSISSRHGANVVSAGNTVTWCLKKHLGTCTTNRPLKKGDSQKFKVRGTGHLLLGLLPSRPDLDKLVDVEPTSAHSDGHFTLFKLKRETATVSLKRTQSREITFTRLSQGQSERKSIVVRNKDIFVFWEILFGDLSVEIDKESSPKVCFDISTCRNVTLENSQTVLKLVDPNYGALCCSDRALETGEVIRLNISQCPDANTTYTKLFLSNKDPSQFDFDVNHVSSNRFLFPTGGKEFKKKGIAQMRISEGTLLGSYQGNPFSLDIGGPNIDGNRPSYLYLELYRVSVQMESVLPETEEDAEGEDEVDGVPNCAWSLRNHDYETLTPPGQAHIYHGDDATPPEHSCDADGYLKAVPDHGDSRSTCSPRSSINREDSGSPGTSSKRSSINREDSGSPGTCSQRSSTGGEVRRSPGACPQRSSMYRGDSGSPGTSSKKSSMNREDSGSPSTSSQRYSMNREDSGSPGTSSQRSSMNREDSGSPGTYAQRSSMNREDCESTGTSSQRSSMNREVSGSPGTCPQRPSTDGEDSGPGASGASCPREPQSRNTPINEVEFAKLLRKNNVKLMERMYPDPMADHLYQDGFMDDAEYENYMATKTRREKCHLVLTLLKRRPDSMNTFIGAMRRSPDGDLLQKMGLAEL